EGVRGGHAVLEALEDPLDVLRLVVGRHDDQHAVAHRRSASSRTAFLRLDSTGRTAPSRAAAPRAASAHSGPLPSRRARVVASRCAISSTRTAGSNSREERRTDPSGATTAEIPLVAAMTTLRPCSTARSRLSANCCSLSSVWPNVALLVWTTSIPAPP